jgi:hypothetical protein
MFTSSQYGETVQSKGYHTLNTVLWFVDMRTADWTTWDNIFTLECRTDNLDPRDPPYHCQMSGVSDSGRQIFPRKAVC